MERLTRRDITGIPFCQGAGYLDMLNKLAAYEDAEEQGRLVVLPCVVGDKVKDIIADYIFTVQKIETVHVHGKDCLIFRCGNEGTRDYMAFYDFEIGDKVKILTREKAEKALEGMG